LLQIQRLTSTVEQQKDQLTESIAATTAFAAAAEQEVMDMVAKLVHGALSLSLSLSR
jgi:hypothetical protein